MAETPALHVPSICVDILVPGMKEEVDSMMISPVWQNQTRYPTLLQILTSFPVLLPEIQDILTSPRGEHHPMAMEGHLALAVWPNHGVVPQQRTFRRGYQDAQQVLQELIRVSICFSLETVE